MVEQVSGVYDFQSLPVEKLWEKDDDQVLAFRRGDLIFVFNWNPTKSFDGYGFLARPENTRWFSTAIPKISAALGL